MKKIFGFGWKKKGQSPSGGASLPCPAGAYDIQHKELSKLHRAAASGDLAQVRRGLKKFSIDGRDKAARTPLHLACANGHVDVVTYLVESKCKLNLPDSDNRSPLMKAVQCQQEKCVAILLEHGAEPNLPDADGNTALHLSVISPNTTVAELLLDYYANIEARNKEGFTPLALAISEHQEEIVEFLLGHGADVHARDQRERTPLMIAASDGELNLVKVLLRYGADVSHTDPHEWTAEDYAVIHGYSSLSELLAQHADSENTGEASAGAAAGLPVLSIPPWVGTAGIKLGAPAVDREMQQSPNHTSRTGKSRKAIDDSSQGDSVSSEKEEGDDTWHTSEEEELDFTPKKPQKPNLTLLMNASQKFRKKNDGDGSRIESPKLPEKSLREEQEEEDQENEETQSKDIQVEKQGKKTKPKGEINQKLKYFTNAKYEGEAWCGTGDVCDDDHKITEFSSSKGLSFSEKPSNSQLKTPESALEMKETSPKKRQQDPGECSGSTCRMSSSAEKEDIKDAFENDEMQDKYILETINLIQKTARENQTDKAEIPPQEALVENEKMHSADKQLSPKPWEERYERMWVESEKRELKTNFKSITAELKQLFGEINETRKTTSLVGEMSEEGFSEEVKSSCVVSSRATESDKRLENKGEFGDLKLKRGGKVPKTEIVIPSLGVLPDQNNLNANLEGSWSTDEDDSTNHADNIKVPLAKGEEEKMPVMEMEENENGSSRNVMGRPEYSPRRNLNTNILDDVSNILPKIQSVSTSDENALFVRERKLGKDSGFNGDVPRECLIDNNKRETEIESLLANAQPLCGTLKKNLDEELKQDMERFKSKVGVLQIVFLALEKEKVQLQKEVEKEKSKRRCFKTEVMANQEDLDKLNTPPGNITDEQMKQKVTLRKKDSSKIETGNTAEVKDEKNFSSEKRLKCIKMPMKGKPSLNAKVSKKNKRQASKKKADKQMSSCAGNNFQVLDDSTFSETSQDERRPAAKLGSEKNKVSTQMDVTADRDLARSSDTTSADAELPTSTCKEAMLLLEQLHVDHTSSAILLKLQNILLEYERIIEHEKNRYLAVWREVRKLESEKESSQLRAEETQEWKNDIQSLKCTLKQEEEKRLRVETLYEKTSETLRKKEDQYCKEMEEKQQLELRSRNLEMELITLRKLLKQVEEERDDTRRQLSQEKSARALQEEILNHHLWRQKELEEEARRSIEKNADESDTEREKDLLYKNQLLQDEITRLRVELDQVRFRHQEEEGKYLEENETLKVKTEDLKKELKLNEEALAQTVFQYNGQLSLLKTESAVLNSKLEQTKESKDRLETEIESFRSRLNTTLQELERHQSSKSDVERTLQRERDEWLRLQDRLHRDLSDVQETNQSLSQQLSKAESKANSLENELHQLKQTLREKTLLLEMTQKELSQAQSQAKECDHARQLEKDQVNKFIIKQESMQERLAHFQSENLLLRQQLEDMQNKGILKEKVVNDMQDRFNDIFNKLRADTEKQVYLVEERNKELNAKCTDLREQVFKYETDKVEREGMIRQLQQELADALKKQSMSEASLEVTARYRSDLEEDKLRLQKELEKVKTKIHNRLEELMSSLQTTQAAAEDHHHQQIGELSQQLEAQSRKCKDLEAENQDLQEELSTMREKHQKLETRKCQLIEEVANLKHHLKTSMVDHNHMEQYKKEVEQRAEQEIRQKLQEVNLFLQTQAACQDRLEQIRASHHASLRKQLKYRIRDLECELDRIKNIQQDNIFQKESTQAEVERYKGLYLEEVKIRRCLANKLERANEKLAEANAHLLQERHRNKSLIASSIVSGGVAPSPVLYSNELGHLGNNLALNRSLSLGGSFLSPAESTLSSRNRVEAYVAKVRQELDEKITKDLEQATAELKTGSTGASPVGSTDGSSKNAHVDQDPLCRAIQEYRDVLTKNYRIC
ncbi:ankyrin repeat domain-containing protein 26 isoform D [Patagioenas fasciata monilis]|uniref:Ankyrin repeat domain-containing protein 26 isoform D n=1 Tax=Patagioenas fasciata monilis TaxID=372326 RepID=A0A1V4J8Z7_PATFA|nr:ankyrin repeat domain-containing protein 26 isoform D [Patagioenas fasciata monilis]